MVDYQGIIRTELIFNETEGDSLTISRLSWSWSIVALENFGISTRLPFLRLLPKDSPSKSGLGDIVFELNYQTFLSNLFFSCIGSEVILPTANESLTSRDSRVIFAPYLANTLASEYLNIFTEVGLRVPFYDFESKRFSIGSSNYFYRIALKSSRWWLFATGFGFSRTSGFSFIIPEVSIYFAENWEVVGGIEIPLRADSLTTFLLGTRLRL